jgi:hypothetical protein
MLYDVFINTFGYEKKDNLADNIEDICRMKKTFPKIGFHTHHFSRAAD